MEYLKPNKKGFLAVIGFLLVLFTWKTVVFFTAKPKITVDYVAEYNRTSMPPDYDLEYNAVPYYQKAFDVFVDRPNGLRMFRCNWPGDLNDTEKILLEEWLSSNAEAFEYFYIAANKPYWWAEASAKDNDMDRIGFPGGSFPRKVINALIWNAKVKSTKGEFKSAFENILTCYKAGKHKCRPNLLVSEQGRGLSIKQDALEDAFIILDRVKVESESLKFLQDALQEEIDNDTYIPSLQTENFLIYDNLQRTLNNNGRGTGRLAWSKSKELYLFIDELSWDKSRFDPIWELIGRLFFCIIGPTCSDMEKEILVNNQIDQRMAKTPWQIQLELDDYTKKIKKIWHTNTSIGMRLICLVGRIYPDDFCMSLFENWFIFNSYHQTKAQTQALITTLSILQFKNDYNRFPETLEELVSTSYLQSLPMDPYSDGPLVYKLTDDNFTLYSFGENLKDDRGIKYPPRRIYPSTGIQKPLDEVYWPVKRWPLLQWYKSQTTGK